MKICKLCDKKFEPKLPGQVYCGTKCSRTNRKVMDAYVSGRLASCPEPKGVIMKVLRNLNVPTMGVSFYDRSEGPGRYGANVFDS